MRKVALLLASCVVLLAACGGDNSTTLKLSARPQAPPPRFNKTALTADEGKVTIKFNNPSDSVSPHNVVIEDRERGRTYASALVGPGKSSSVTANLKPGSYEFYCGFKKHRQFGMKGTLTVK